MSESNGFFKPFPQSRKIYVPGKIFPDLKVAMREISLDDPKCPVLPVYDTSGAYGDPDKTIDVKKGLERIREPWIRERLEKDGAHKQGTRRRPRHHPCQREPPGMRTDDYRTQFPHENQFQHR